MKEIVCDGRFLGTNPYKKKRRKKKTIDNFPEEVGVFFLFLLLFFKDLSTPGFGRSDLEDLLVVTSSQALATLCWNMREPENLEFRRPQTTTKETPRQSPDEPDVGLSRESFVDCLLLVVVSILLFF